MDNEEIQKMIEFFQGCSVTTEKEKIQNELKRTAVVRQRLWKQKDMRMPGIFNFYLVDPSMVRKQCCRIYLTVD